MNNSTFEEIEELTSQGRDPHIGDYNSFVHIDITKIVKIAEWSPYNNGVFEGCIVYTTDATCNYVFMKVAQVKRLIEATLNMKSREFLLGETLTNTN